MKKTAVSMFHLNDKDGSWLGQIVITSDGGFFAMTDYGNFNFAWRHFGDGDFREFLIGLNTHYFASKMYQGIAYVAFGKKIEKACERFAEKILPALQASLKSDIENGIEF